MNKHNHLNPHVQCTDCGRSMYRIRTTREYILYGCAMGHLQRVARTDGDKPVDKPTYEPPDAA